MMTLRVKPLKSGHLVIVVRKDIELKKVMYIAVFTDECNLTHSCVDV